LPYFDGFLKAFRYFHEWRVIATLEKLVRDERYMNDEFKDLVSSKHVDMAVTAYGNSCQSFCE
jgi:hypothetical protein